MSLYIIMPMKHENKRFVNEPEAKPERKIMR